MLDKSLKMKMDDVFERMNKDLPVAILVHPSPDPDCLGAADGFALLIKEVYNLNNKIYHLGEISHTQNKSMKNVLHISLADGNSLDLDAVAAVVVLDTDLEGSGFKSDKLSKVNVRIDHHMMDRGSGAEFSDIRAVGSTCAIVWDYLNAFEVSLEERPDTATAMAIGIKTDTLDFTSATTTELDIEAYRSLLSCVNKTSLSKVIKYSLPKLVFETEAKAFKDKEIRNTTLVSCVGDITPHNRDFIPMIADRFSRIDGVNTAVIMGIIDNFVVASIRSEDSKVDVNDLCVTVFGKDNAGGKEGSGGARFYLGPAYELLDDKEIKDKVKEQVISILKDKVFEALGEHKEEK